MTQFSTSTTQHRGRLFGVALLATLLLAGCSAEWLNRQPAQEIAQRTKAPGSAYVGWRVFQQRCASCHGADATGTVNAPDLLPRMKDIGPRRFAGLVLQRYDWNLPPDQASNPGAARENQVEVVMQRKDAPLTMPAWQGEPVVSAQIMDLYAYLAARSEGTAGPGRPQP